MYNKKVYKYLIAFIAFITTVSFVVKSEPVNGVFFRQYNSANGLTNEKINALYLNTGNNDDVLAAGDNHYIRFNPSHVPKLNLSPRVHFPDFSIFNKSLNQLLYKSGIVLDKSQNYFTIDFSAPDYGRDNIQYAYRLIGIDTNWVMAGIKNSVSYSNLKPGRYRFEVKASNWKGSYASKFSSLSIIVEPPFYEKAWFYILVVITICFIIYHVYMYQIRELKKIQDVRNGIAKDLHDQVGSTLSSIAVYTEVARIFQQQHKHTEVENLLKVIGETSTSIVQEMTDIVWSIDPKNDHLDSIIKRIESYAKPLCSAKGIRFSIYADPQLFHDSMNMSIRKNLFLILKEAINNAIKHANCRLLEVFLEIRDEIVVLGVKDDGVGFSYVQNDHNTLGTASGNGLFNMKARSKQMDGTLNISSANGIGTWVSVTFRRI